jgi:putative N6-adenine-specific DNA methylase
MKYRIVITCPKGIPPVLAREVSGLGLAVVRETKSAVETEGDLADAMRLNLYLRTGHRVLIFLKEFPASSPEEMYENVKGIPWEEFLSEDGYFSVTSTLSDAPVGDSRFASLKCKDAVADRMTLRRGRRPDSGPRRSGAVVHLRWAGDRGEIFLDTTGEPLSRRSYRRIPLAAPLQETLAAAIVLTANWTGEDNFVNPMCGSGTLAIEAALIGMERAPGLLRNRFAFMYLREFREETWKAVRREASGRKKRLPGRIIATDIDPAAVEATRKNAATAGVDHLLETAVCDFSETEVPAGGGVVVVNPGYGERLGDMPGLERQYAGIGDFFKKKCQGYRGYVFTGNPGLAKRIGLKTRRRIPFYNGPIECRLLEFDLYAGSRKHANEKNEPGEK